MSVTNEKPSQDVPDNTGAGLAGTVSHLESNSAQNTAKKFLALALTAYAAKQFEEAGCLFAQAAECSDVTKLTDALLQPVTDHLPENQDPITADNQQQLASDIDGDEWGDEDETPEPPETDELTPSTEDSGGGGGGEGEGEGEGEDTDSTEETDEESESTSSGAEHLPLRRRVTSMYQIGKILAASMEATSADDSEREDTSESEDIGADEEDDSMEPDPDIPGERLIPVSFSSVTVKKGLAVNSPVKLKQ